MCSTERSNTSIHSLLHRCLSSIHVLMFVTDEGGIRLVHLVWKKREIANQKASFYVSVDRDWSWVNTKFWAHIVTAVISDCSFRFHQASEHKESLVMMNLLHCSALCAATDAWSCFILKLMWHVLVLLTWLCYCYCLILIKHHFIIVTQTEDCHMFQSGNWLI